MIQNKKKHKMATIEYVMLLLLLLFLILLRGFSWRERARSVRFPRRAVGHSTWSGEQQQLRVRTAFRGLFRNDFNIMPRRCHSYCFKFRIVKIEQISAWHFVLIPIDAFFRRCNKTSSLYDVRAVVYFEIEKNLHSNILL